MRSSILAPCSGTAKTGNDRREEGKGKYRIFKPNDVLQQTGHANEVKWSSKFSPVGENRAHPRFFFGTSAARPVRPRCRVRAGVSTTCRISLAARTAVRDNDGFSPRPARAVAAALTLWLRIVVITIVVGVRAVACDAIRGAAVAFRCVERNGHARSRSSIMIWERLPGSAYVASGFSPRPARAVAAALTLWLRIVVITIVGGVRAVACDAIRGAAVAFRCVERNGHARSRSAIMMWERLPGSAYVASRSFHSAS